MKIDRLGVKNKSINILSLILNFSLFKNQYTNRIFIKIQNGDKMVLLSREEMEKATNLINFVIHAA
jgi:hypothetical protein